MLLVLVPILLLCTRYPIMLDHVPRPVLSLWIVEMPCRNRRTGTATRLERAERVKGSILASRFMSCILAYIIHSPFKRLLLLHMQTFRLIVIVVVILVVVVL